MKTLSYTIAEAFTMTKRNFWKSLKNPDRLIGNLFDPMMTLLLFVYVLGGAMNYGSEINYINYVVPGVLILCIGQCSAGTAISVSEDIQNGIVDRFRSMPISTSSVITGHVIETVIRIFMSLLFVFTIALLVGFRPNAPISSWILAFILLLLFSFMITWVSVVYGLFVKGAEGAGSLNLFITVIIYLSTGFIPTQTLPSILRVFAENQPATWIIEALRRLLLSQPLENYLFMAILCCVTITVIAYITALHLYKSKVNH